MVVGEKVLYFEHKVEKMRKVKERDKQLVIRIWRVFCCVLVSYFWSQVVGLSSLSKSDMAGEEIDDLVVHLERNLELSSMETWDQVSGLCFDQQNPEQMGH